MKYNFDEIVKRDNNNAAKYCEMGKRFGNDDMIPLWIADMDFKVADEIKNAIKEKAEQAIYGYTYRPDSYYKSYRDWQEKRNNYKFDLDLFSHCMGVIPAMRIYIELFTKKNAKILIQEPVYSPFRTIIENTKRTVLVNELKEENNYYKIDFKDFEEKIKQSDLFLLCNPHNPVGRAWSKEELLKIAEICKKYNVDVISDEVHSDLMINAKHEVFKKYYEKTITYIAASKTFNLAGLQAAVCIFYDKNQKEIYDKRLVDMDMARNNAFSVEAIEAAFKYGEVWLEELLQYLKSNVEFVQNYIKDNLENFEMTKVEATYLAWIKTSIKDEDMDEIFYSKAKVGIIKGINFGKSGSSYIRINLACPRIILKEALERIKNAVKDYKK